jgi:16S rRNA processing protein RimM
LQIEDLIEIGTIVAPQGLRGELRVKSNSDFPERFEQPGVRWLQIQSYQFPIQIELIRGKQLPGKNIFIVKLSGIDDRNQAETLRGAKLFIPKSDRPHLEEDEYHVSDLIGLEVYHQQTGENIGVICDVFTAGNDILEVKLHKQPELPKEEIKEIDISQVNRFSKQKKIKRKRNKKKKPVTILIPFVKEIVPIIDLKQKIIKIAPPRGLINLDLVEESK